MKEERRQHIEAARGQLRAARELVIENDWTTALKLVKHAVSLERRSRSVGALPAA